MQRFSLRFLFATFVVLSCLLTAVRIVDSQRRAIESLESAGAEVYVDDKGRNHGIHSITPRQTWIARNYFDPVINVELNARCTDLEMKCILSFPELRSLKIDGANITDFGFESLSGLPRLTFIGVRNVQLTENALHNLSQVPTLVDLRLSNVGLQDANLTQLSGCKLDAVCVADNALITDSATKLLAEMISLKYIDLRCTQISDAGLIAFESSQNLEILLLDGTRVTANGVTKLRNSIPMCNVFWENDVPFDNEDGSSIFSH